MRSVTIIGAGPAGLSAARVLCEAGLRDVLVLERNPEAGGLPRFAAHPGWGMLDFHRFWNGPTYARKLVEAAKGVEIRTDHSVVALHENATIEVNGPGGTSRIESRAVLVATGIREASRAARLLSGSRPWGVVSTGAFQEMVYRGGARPFRSPIVLGTELVSFSALLTARHAGIRVRAMIEPGERITARRPSDLVARYLLGVPVRTRTRLVRIEGLDSVTGVVVEQDGREERISCDGVILTGDFLPEAALLRAGHLAVDPATGGPVIDSSWRCSDPSYFAAGNLLRPVEHSGAAALEGRRAAAAILKALEGRLPSPVDAVVVRPGAALRYIYPQRLLPSEDGVTLFARTRHRCTGTLKILSGNRILAEKRVDVLPERRLTLHLPAEAGRQARERGEDITVEIA